MSTWYRISLLFLIAIHVERLNCQVHAVLWTNLLWFNDQTQSQSRNEIRLNIHTRNTSKLSRTQQFALIEKNLYLFGP